MRKADRLAREALEHGDLRTAEARFTEILRLDPENDWTLGDLAKVYDPEGRRDDVYALYHKILRESPEVHSSLQRDPRVLARYGELAEARGDLLEARWVYLRAASAGIGGLPPAEVRPTGDGLAALRAAAFGRAGTTAAGHGENEEAVAFLQKAARADPRSWAVRYHLGLALRYVGKRAEGEAALAQAEGLAGANAAFVRSQERPDRPSRTLGTLIIGNGKAYHPPAP